MKSPATLHCKWGCSELLLPGNLQDDTFLDSLFWNALSWEPLSLRLYKTPSVTTEKEMPWESFHVPVEIQKTISRAVDVYLKIHLCKFLGSQKLDRMFSTASLIQYDFCEHYTGKNYLLQTLLLWTIWLFFFFFCFFYPLPPKPWIGHCWKRLLEARGQNHCSLNLSWYLMNLSHLLHVLS